MLAGLIAASASSRAVATAAKPIRQIPDLQGMWSNRTGTPLERPRSFKSLVLSEPEAQAFEFAQRGVITPVPGDDVGQAQADWFEPAPPLSRIRGEARTSVIVDPTDGRLPYSAAGRKVLGGRMRAMGDFDGPESRPAPERCLIGFGAPADAPLLYAPQTTGDYQFIQTRDHLVIRTETNNDLRVIDLNPALQSAQSMRPWMGASRGHWDGDGLVVETSRFNPGETLRSIPYQLCLSQDARVTERFTRTSPREMLYAFAVDDPSLFTQVWRGELIFRTSSAPIYEYACHEGNYSLSNILAGARRAERDRAAARP
jgi:hypothetical protein